MKASYVPLVNDLNSFNLKKVKKEEEAKEEEKEGLDDLVKCLLTSPVLKRFQKQEGQKIEANPKMSEDYSEKEMGNSSYDSADDGDWDTEGKQKKKGGKGKKSK